MSLRNAVNWFEIPVSDFDRAVAFYEEVFQLKFKKEAMAGFDLAIFPTDDKAVSGALIKADFLSPAETGSVVYLNAEGMLDSVIDRVKQKGAKVFIEKTEVGEDGFIAHIGDSEGNRVAVHSFS